MKVTIGTKTEESSNNIPFKLVEVGSIIFINEVIDKYFHKGYEPIGLASDDGIWYLLIKTRVDKSFKYL